MTLFFKKRYAILSCCMGYVASFIISMLVLMPQWVWAADTLQPVAASPSPLPLPVSVQVKAKEEVAPLAATDSDLSRLVPPPPLLKATGYLLIDANSGYVLASKNADQRLAPASLTKMMTLYIISQALKSQQIHLTDQVSVSESAWHMHGSRMFLKPHADVAVSDLIQGIIVDSGNDASLAMAEYIAGSEEAFAHLMNQAAAKLNLDHSHFVSSTGLPDKNHYSTPGDLARLAQALIRDFPEYYHWYKQKWFTYNKIKQPNRNRLLWRDPSVDGIKTGHTDEAGFCLVSSAERDKQRLIAVVMGTPTDATRFSESQKLLNYGFRFFATKLLYLANSAIARPTVWFGQQPKTNLGVAQPAYLTLPKQFFTGQQLSAKLVVKSPLQAPIVQDQVYGQVNIYFNKKQVSSIPLVALESNPMGGWFSRVTDNVSLFFHNLLGYKNKLDVVGSASPDAA